MTSAESATLTAAHVYAAAMRAESTARKAYKLTQRAPGTPAPEVRRLHDAMVRAEDATMEARSAMIRAVRGLNGRNAADIVGAP
ncbi:hypothetical protein GCM10022631_04700 [Deinococcus rubellus]|uniref:Uncharacterized protein n=1 Tax=Deinococcus rubellus TaxID=1889240 RepID=A0ABY5YIK6_9DEIO|nr:hypothetical protein [Deinococcus rubellus]UWX64177.1 hypothetical protein N0D28_00400 [Deinococcus rubellus]